MIILTCWVSWVWLATLTKKQKIMVQNYAQAVEAEEHPQASSMATPSISRSAVTSRADPRNGSAKEAEVTKAKTIIKSRMTHVEWLKGAIEGQFHVNSPNCNRVRLMWSCSSNVKVW